MSESGEPPKKKIRPPEKSIRYFINNITSQLSHELIEVLRNDQTNKTNPHLILGTSHDNQQTPIPDGVRKIIDKTKISFLGKIILDSDVVILDLTSADVPEIEYIIKTLKMGDYQEEKILICISSVMVWSNTPPKEKKEEEEPAEGADDPNEFPEDPDSEPEEQEPKEPVAEDEQPKKVYVRFTEKDYPLRKPLAKYEILKALETLCLSSGNSKPHLKSYVLCSGILYGKGETVFYEHLKRAWLQDPQELVIYGDGKNRIPSIHISDLAMFLKKVVEKPPANKYLFAIDQNKKPTQKSIVQAISKGVGTGKTKLLPLTEVPASDEFADVFQLNLRMKPSAAFNAALEEAAAQEEPADDDEEPRPPKLTFEWKCKEGIQANIAKINTEFNLARDLKPIRIFITGPPASGKTFWGNQLAKYYNIPHILIKDIVEAALKQEDEAGEELRKSLEEEKEKLVEEAREKLDKEKERLEKKGLPVPENMEVDESKIFPRLKDELLYGIFQKRLKQNDCQNRGFLLDGFPRSYENAKGVFLTPAPLKEGQEEGDEENRPKILDEKINPHFVFNLNASDEFLFKRVRNLPEEKISGTHYEENEMFRRLEQYSKLNETVKGFPVLLNFFAEHKIDILNVNVEMVKTDIFSTLRAFVEKNGKFNNYQTHEEKAEKERIDKMRMAREKILQQSIEAENEWNEKEAEIRAVAFEEYKLKTEEIKREEKNILETQSLPLRLYLNENVVPFITEGILEVCKELPEDPVDYLAEFLFRKSLSVPFPDPGSFNSQSK